MRRVYGGSGPFTRVMAEARYVLVLQLIPSRSRDSCGWVRGILPLVVWGRQTDHVPNA